MGQPLSRRQNMIALTLFMSLWSWLNLYHYQIVQEHNDIFSTTCRAQTAEWKSGFLKLPIQKWGALSGDSEYGYKGTSLVTFDYKNQTFAHTISLYCDFILKKDCPTTFQFPCWGSPYQNKNDPILLTTPPSRIKEMWEVVVVSTMSVVIFMIIANGAFD